ncbi:MAG TPA: dihydropteroate synthase [Candidatus Saccharimonadales bacterium]|nr:dihydropteroate synthase [Candidatus Saccharimonadales bacterium]
MNEFTLYLAGGSQLSADKTLVMGILNATPDSFSDGGDIADPGRLDTRIREMINAGADILDIGGESTRPGHEKVDAGEETARVVPVIRAIRKISKTMPISVDTQKVEVAEEALRAGASLINDVSAFSDKKMAEVVRKHACSVILMRNEPTGSDTVANTKQQFERIIEEAEKHGVDKKYLLLDPGLGFGDLKTGDYSLSPGSDPAANLELIRSISKYSHGLPVVIGASRKRFIGDITGEKDVKKRLGGSLAAAILAAQAGAGIVRVHDVAETVQAFKILNC